MTTFRTVLRKSCAVFCTNLRFCDLQINHKICGFAFCGLSYLRNFFYLRNVQICDSEMSPGICGFAICGPDWICRVRDVHTQGYE